MNTLQRELKKSEIVVLKPGIFPHQTLPVTMRAFIVEGGSGMGMETPETELFGYWYHGGQPDVVPADQIDADATTAWKERMTDGN